MPASPAASRLAALPAHKQLSAAVHAVHYCTQHNVHCELQDVDYCTRHGTAGSRSGAAVLSVQLQTADSGTGGEEGGGPLPTTQCGVELEGEPQVMMDPPPANSTTLQSPPIMCNFQDSPGYAESVEYALKTDHSPSKGGGVS